MLAELAEDLDAQARAAAARDEGEQSALGAVTRLESVLADAERKLVRLALARAADSEGALPDETWKAAAADARAERDQAAADLAAAKMRARVAARRVTPVLHGVLDDWDTLPPAVLNQMLRQLVRRIVVYRTGERSRNAAGHWGPMPVRIEIHPPWLPDPWEATTI
jgi:hypothetical protein